jgi:hypothetical protein
VAMDLARPLPSASRANAPATKIAGLCRHFLRVSEGTRTPDRLDHNHDLRLFSGENGDVRCSKVLSSALRFAQ